MVIRNPGHLVCRRTTDFNWLDETLERADVARTVGLLSLYQTVPALVNRALALSMTCSNITRLNLVSVPMPYLASAVQFDSVRELDVYCTHPASATWATLRLLARMPRLKRLGLRGLVPGNDYDDACPALPCALDAFLWAGAVSADACAHILACSGRTLRTLELYVFSGPAALARILAAAPAVSLRAVSLSVGAHDRHAERTPYVSIVAAFLQRFTGARELTLQLLPGISLSGLLADLSAQTQLRTLCLRDAELPDAVWLAQELAGDNPALAALRAVELEHDAEDDDDDVRETRAEAAAVLRPACIARRIRLSA